MLFIKLTKKRVIITIFLLFLSILMGFLVTYFKNCFWKKPSEAEVKYAAPIKTNDSKQDSLSTSERTDADTQKVEPSNTKNSAQESTISDESTNSSAQNMYKSNKTNYMNSKNSYEKKQNNSKHGVPTKVPEKPKSNIKDTQRENCASLGSKNFSTWNKNCEWNLILLNDGNAIPEGVVPHLRDYGEVKVNAGILADLDAMIKAASNNKINLWISSCFRDIDHQDFLHKRKINFYVNKGNSRTKAEELASRVVARPRTSEHNLGLAVDFNGVRDDFYLTKEYDWLVQNAENYGFILRYDKNKQNLTNKIYEPWHFRYVGKSHAKEIKKQGLCLEEYIESLASKNGDN